MMSWLRSGSSQVDLEIQQSQSKDLKYSICWVCVGRPGGHWIFSSLAACLL